MVCYPEVQKEAQAELDKVLNGRLPEHSDIPSLPYLSALVKEVYRYAATWCRKLFIYAKCISAFRWEPIGPTGWPLFLPYILKISWHPSLVKASLISRPTMIYTKTIISPPNLLWSPTYGDEHILLNIVLYSFLKLHFIGRCWTTNETIQNRTNSNPNAF